MPTKLRVVWPEADLFIQNDETMKDLFIINRLFLTVPVISFRTRFSLWFCLHPAIYPVN
jgi:hypothetical protein